MVYQNNEPSIVISTTRMDLVGSYANAASSLYGALSISEFVTVFNHYEDNKTTARESYCAMLQYLSMRPDKAHFSLYNDYIAGPFLHPGESEEDEKRLDALRARQKDKPRYMPAGKSELLKYQDAFYIEPKKPYDDLKAYILQNELNTETSDVDSNLRDLFAMEKNRVNPAGIIQYFIDAGYRLRNIDEINAFLKYLNDSGNNTRLFENNGFTPEEMRGFQARNRQEGPIIHQPKKVGRNDPCPCGSGKKYKMCCAILEASGSAQLSYSERKLFYETWYKLLDYVNRKLNVVDYKFSLTYPSEHDETLLHQIREGLWNKPKLIAEFIADNDNRPALSDKEIDLLQSWDKHHIKGQFILIKYLPDAAVLMQMEKGKDIKLFAVKGMTTSISEAMRKKLPIMLNTILLPINDKIVYDSFMDSHAIEFGGGIMDMFDEEYAKAEEKYGIIRKLA